jgi:hypothetical protein
MLYLFFSYNRHPMVERHSQCSHIFHDFVYKNHNQSAPAPIDAAETRFGVANCGATFRAANSIGIKMKIIKTTD